jgi:predicted ATP-binding protein involved in virulence
MKINSIKIENLFEIFDYDISFRSNENVLIITGPNGYGKTMVLNIIFNLFNRRFQFFQKLIFAKITLRLDENISIIISKSGEDAKKNTNFSFSQNGKHIESFNYSNEVERHLKSDIEKYLPVMRVAPEKWMDRRTERIFTLDELLDEYSDQLPEEISKNILRIKSDTVNKILDSIQVHLIKEQRLFKKALNIERNYREAKDQTIMVDTIQTYAKELKDSILSNIQKSFNQTQALDSSYLDRLIDEKFKISESDYNFRLSSLNEKQEKLIEFGLYESKQKIRNYSEADAKALLVYINDLEQKLSVFDSLLEKLELFTTILNERRFTFKSININTVKGFFFKTSKGNDLELSQLSSGEQHEVVLLYELIFNVKPDILVLIDEPEISLHITWQKEFLNDLLKIIKIQNIQVVVATHSPSIINDRWDLVYNLETVKVK